jgi:ABC-type branched-subunit amino acid transport system substrate-binding protein
MGRRAFLAAAGSNSEGVLIPLLDDPATGFQGFAAKFQSHFHVFPDFAAAQAYDATCLLITAIRKAGLNRARIGDAVRELSPWQGLAGIITWDPLGENTRPVRLGVIHRGRVLPAEKNPLDRRSSEFTWKKEWRE